MHEFVDLLLDLVKLCLDFGIFAKNHFRVHQDVRVFTKRDGGSHFESFVGMKRCGDV